MNEKNKKPHKFESATWAEIEKFLKAYEEWYSAPKTFDSGGQPTPPPPPPPGGPL